MSLYDHLAELRSRLMRSLGAVLAIFAVGLFFSTELIEWLKEPLLAVLPGENKDIHIFNPVDAFTIKLKVALLAGLVGACPVWIHQFWRFIEPALYANERKYILPFILGSISLFVAGVTFCYLIIFPMALEFFINMGAEIGTPTIGLKEYFNLLLLLVIGFGAVFQTPIVLILLAVLDLVSSEALAQYRRFIIVVILVVAAILTPPDPLSQIGLAIPMYIMYEISIIIIRRIEKRGARKE
jgi:sec-independent protein translocase protein TatC